MQAEYVFGAEAVILTIMGRTGCKCEKYMWRKTEKNLDKQHYLPLMPYAFGAILSAQLCSEKQSSMPRLN
ncbi:hypothetical protein KSB_30210 [Ktedonobacter robiniae]|uniref:Uncharacterized protein n=1 Tax=Ktedonobacter robiniae TaxID=2778365 RepID=A0ABQ3UP97_9CHLR|nr:hypothetical protein KSB_30210 [Ktedonobacter robiniae]